MTPSIKIRSDLSSCTQVPAIKLEVSLPNPQQSLIMEVPPLDDLPLFNSRTDAGVKLLKKINKELARGPKPREVKHFVEIVRPFASDMKLLEPSLVKEFNQYVPFRVSFMLTLTVGVFATALHLLFMYIFNRYNLAIRVSKIFEDLKRKLPLRQMVEVPTEHENKIPSLESKHGDRFHFHCASSSKSSDAVVAPSFHTRSNSHNQCSVSSVIMRQTIFPGILPSVHLRDALTDLATWSPKPKWNHLFQLDFPFLMFLFALKTRLPS